MSIWTVDPYCDGIRERDEKHRNQEVSDFGARRFFVFDTERAAVQFVIDRAEKEIRKAKDAIKNAERRIKRHRTRLANFPQSDKNDTASSGVD